MEFQMQTDLSVIVPSTIGFNFDEIMAELDTQLERYRNNIVTKDGIADAKADLARLRKLQKAIEDKRKEIKKEYCKPLDEFEGKVKQIVAKIDEPVKEINAQLVAYEDQRKAEKEEQIYDLYHETVPGDVKGILLFERIFDQKWLNKGVSLDEIRDTISITANRVQSDVEALKVVDPEHAAAVRREYYKTLDLSAAMRCLTELREAAAAMKQAAPTENKPEPVKPVEAVQEPQREPQEAPADEKLYKLRLEFDLTQQQAAGLKQYLIDNGINFKKI